MLFCYAGGVNEEVVAAIAEREHERRLPRVRSCSSYLYTSICLFTFFGDQFLASKPVLHTDMNVDSAG